MIKRGDIVMSAGMTDSGIRPGQRGVVVEVNDQAVVTVNFDIRDLPFKWKSGDRELMSFTGNQFKRYALSELISLKAHAVQGFKRWKGAKVESYFESRLVFKVDNEPCPVYGALTDQQLVALVTKPIVSPKLPFEKKANTMFYRGNFILPQNSRHVGRDFVGENVLMAKSKCQFLTVTYSKGVYYVRNGFYTLASVKNQQELQAFIDAYQLTVRENDPLLDFKRDHFLELYPVAEQAEWLAISQTLHVNTSLDEACQV